MKEITLHPQFSSKFMACFLSGFFLLLLGCEKEDFSEVNKNSRPKAIAQDKDSTLVFGTLADFENLPSLGRTLDIGLSAKPTNYKSQDNNDYDFVVDIKKIVRIQYQGNYYYTMRIIREDKHCSTCFQNLVISDIESKEPEAYIFSYEPDQGFFAKNGLAKFPFRGGVKVKKLDFDKLGQNVYKGQTCISVTYLMCDYGGEAHAAGSNCTQTYMVSQNLCISTSSSGVGTGVGTYSNNYYESEHYNPPSGGGGGGGVACCGDGDTGDESGPDLDMIDPNDPMTLPLIDGPLLYASGLDYQLGGISEVEFDWALANTNDAAKIFLFMKDNGFSNESKDFARLALEALMDGDYTEILNLELFNRDPYDVWGTLSQEEKDLIISFPFKAFEIFKNREIAENATRSKFGFNGRNNKSDAFRHAYFNAINTKDVGSYFAEIFADAHESDVPPNLDLEKSMDLFNNAVGHDANIDFPNYSKSDLIDAIYGKLLNGELRYLSPLGPIVPPNFGINSLTQLIPTDQ